MATEEQVAAALIVAANAQLSSYGGTTGAVKMLDYDDARGVILEHVQLSVARRFTPVERAGREAQKPWRITTRPVAVTVSNGREMARRVDTALNGVRITAGGVASTPLRLESADDIGPDDGKFTGLTTWTFVL